MDGYRDDKRAHTRQETMVARDLGLKLLWDVVDPNLGACDFNLRIEAAIEIARNDATIPNAIEPALNALLAHSDEAHLSKLQTAVAQAGLWRIGPERFAALVTHLTIGNLLPLTDAARVLASIPYGERQGLPSQIQYLLDVADAVVEDFREGRMNPDEDDVLMAALRAIANVGSSNPPPSG